jgi:WLM domain
MLPYLLGGIFSAALINTHPTDKMKELMHRYTILREYLIETGEFPVLHKECTVIGMNGISKDGVGYNVGKGFEIYICMNGPINNIMHVFLHELAHNTVDEYDHSNKFWDNLDELKAIAKSLHIYEHTPAQPFCDGTIGD